eukprot:scaffold1769_cov164-Ochromonas_danica.AAC.14
MSKSQKKITDRPQLMASENMAINVQRDWSDREFAQIASFLSDFDSKVRSKLAIMNERVSALERQVELCDAICKATLDSHKQTPA